MWPPNDRWRDSGECLADWTSGEIQLVTTQIADAIVGLDENEQDYRDLLFPHDDLAQQSQMAKAMYACALTCGAILRCLGVDHPSLDQPYAEQFARLDAMTRLQVIGKAFGAWETGALIPMPGEIVIIGSGIHTHALTVLHTDVKNKIVYSVDATRKPDGTDVIVRTERRIQFQGKDVALHDNVVGARVVYGVLHTGKLKPTRNWVMPPMKDAPVTAYNDEDTKVD